MDEIGSSAGGQAPGNEMPALRKDRFAAAQTDLDRAAHVPGQYYSSSEFFQLELQKRFLRDWLFVARVEEVARPGDYIALRLVDQPIVISRDNSGELRAFYNMCLHRGVEVASGQGNARAFQCPYHGWTYDLGGRLIGAPFMDESEGFDKSNCQMRPIQIAVWDGNIFVCFDPAPPAFDDFVAHLAPQFAIFRMQDCKSANRIVVDLDCNWKLGVENLMDYYHVGVLHGKTFGNRVSWQGQKIDLSDDGGYFMWYRGQASTPGGKVLLGTFPWLVDQPEGFSCVGCLPPNLCIFARFDCVKVSVVWPLGHNRCSLVTYHLFPDEFFKLPNFEEARKVYKDYQIEIFEEDRSMIESLQKAMASPVFVPGRMSVAEKQIHNHINGHLRKVLG